MNIDNTDHVLELIEQIANTPGKNDKIALLKAHGGEDLLRDVLAATYDPLVSYGVRAFPTRVAGSGGVTMQPEHWDIIKRLAARTLTGGAMQAALQNAVDQLTEYSAEVFKRIILKDMRAGFSEETCNKVWPKLLADFPYMRCCLPKDSKIDEWIDKEGGISQEKADGMFINANHEETGLVSIYSRNGSMFPMEKFAGLEQAIRATLTAGTQTHGELLVFRMTGDPDVPGRVLERQEGNGMLNSVLQGGDFELGCYPVFMVWDQIPLSAVVPKGKYDVPYKERFVGLVKQVRAGTAGHITVIPSRVVKSKKEAYEHAGELMLQDKEGTVLKRMSATWKDGTSKEQVKLKLEFEVDLEITAILPGEDNTKNEGRPGRLACASSDNLLQVNVAVKNEAMRAALEAAPHDWIGQIMPVTANLIMKPSDSNQLHSLFLPRFSQDTYRTDKTAADSLPTIVATQDAAKLGQKLKHDAEKKAA